MLEPLSDSMRQIARGAGTAMFGLIASLFLQFFARLIIARYGLEANYGILSLTLMVLNFAMILSCFGLQHGATRYIAFFRDRSDETRAQC
jgi:O-antigen/teichoic acid export membrane protein